MSTAAILLAAGQSRRFGSENKLLADLVGRPVVSYAADTIRALKVEFPIAVTADERVSEWLTDFHITPPEGETAEQSASLKAGIRFAQNLGAKRALIVLADMPLITPEVMQSVLTSAGYDQIAAISHEAKHFPPACFQAFHFDQILSLTGDQGARAILRKAPNVKVVTCPSHQLLDVDTIEDLRNAALQSSH